MRNAGYAVLSLVAGVFGTDTIAAPSPVRDWTPDHVLEEPGFGKLTIVGDVAWSNQGGELIVLPRQEGSGGWLFLDRPLQDVAAYAEFKCADPCRAGIAARVERHPTGGWTAVLAEYGSEQGALSQVSVAASGRETARVPLISGGGGQSRFATPPNGGPAGAAPSVPGVDNPLKPIFAKAFSPIIAIGGDAEAATVPAPSAPASGGGGMAVLRSYAPPPTAPGQGAPEGFRPGEWNSIEVFADTNVAFASLNGTRRISGVTADEGTGFGPIALYVAPGSGEVRFRNVAFKDLGRQLVPPEQLSPHYRVQKLDDFSYAWDTAVADVNRDANRDIVAGPYVYYGPDFTIRRELYVASTFSPGNQYAGNMVTYAGDFTGDGWPDVLATEGRQLALLTNPRNEPRRWTRSIAVPGNLSEIPLLDDLDDDGRLEVILVQSGRVAFAQPKRSNPSAPWPVFYVSDPGSAGLHSFGVGDINGDGRKDILQSRGWWEQPAGGITASLWAFHSFTFGNPERPDDRVEGGGNMAVADLNADGLSDVITTINAHGWGLAWYEQVRQGSTISFVPHLIAGDHARDNPGGLAVSQLHAGAYVADANGDGVPDFFTGKKRWAHLDSHADPDPSGPAYLLLYRGIRDPRAPGGIRFEPEVIHNRAGAGSGLKVTDVNGDGTVDVVTSGVTGTYLFLAKPSARQRKSR